MVKDLRLIQCFVWFPLIFWIVVGHPLTQYRGGQEREKREIQERIAKTRLTQKITLIHIRVYNLSYQDNNHIQFSLNLWLT